MFALGFLCLFMFSCTEEVKQPISIDQVNAQWQTTTIKGVKSADVMDMMVAFQKQLPTNCVAMFLEDVKLPESERQYLSFYYPEEGYLRFAEGSDDPDSESMEARVFQRNNGHQLFAITFDQMSSDVQAFAAFFDYDPSKGTLAPETSMANLFTPSHNNVIFSYSFPEYGNVITVSEYFFNWWYPLEHFYNWNGDGFDEPEVYFDGTNEIIDQFNEDYMTYEMDEFSKYALIDIDEDGEPEIWLSTEDEEYQAVLSVVEGEVKLLAGKDFKRSLTFYKGAVGDAGGCGTGCYYTHFTKLNHSAPEFVINCIQLYQYETDDLSYEYWKDGEELSEEEGDAIMESFGEYVEPQVEWHKLVIPVG